MLLFNKAIALQVLICLGVTDHQTFKDRILPAKSLFFKGIDLILLVETINE